MIRGESLELCLKYYQDEFMELATQAPAVVCCRCSPTQKATVVRLIQRHTGKRTLAIGDGTLVFFFFLSIMNDMLN